MTKTRPATPHDARPVELPNLRAPRLPTFFAEPSTDEPEDTIPNNDPPDGDSDYPEPDDSFLLDYTIDPVTGGVFDRIGRVR